MIKTSITLLVFAAILQIVFAPSVVPSAPSSPTSQRQIEQNNPILPSQRPGRVESYTMGISSNFVGNMAEKRLPPIELKERDGAVITSDMLHGSPVLIDFWATWCQPCVASLPELAALHDEAASKGLVLLSVDQDEDEGKAAAFLSRRGYNWPDFHEGKELEHQMGPSALPRILLVNSEGMIVYDWIGFDVQALRREIAKLGPQFKGLTKDSISADPHE